MDGLKPWARFTHEVATEMIRVSDNTATNLLIDRLGGKDALNARFIALGAVKLVNNWLQTSKERTPRAQGTSPVPSPLSTPAKPCRFAAGICSER